MRLMRTNRIRTLVTILGVAMATAMITMLACIGTTVLATAEGYYKTMEGDAHETFYGVKQENLKYFLNNQSIGQVSLEKMMGMGTIHLKTQVKFDYDYLLRIYGAEDAWYPSKAIHVTSGRFPEMDGEIMLQREVRSIFTEDVKLGDAITVTMLDGTSKTYQVVGFSEQGNSANVFQNTYEKSSNDYYVDQESKKVYSLYNAYVYWERDANLEGNYDVSIRFTKEGILNRREVTSGLLGVSKEFYERVRLDLKSPLLNSEEDSRLFHQRVDRFERNASLEAIEFISPLHLTQDNVLIMSLVEIVFLLFVFAGVFCINNSFDISLTERIRFFGMISSVGTTKGQRKRMVWMEAFIVGGLGIPLGIVLGTGVSFLLSRLTDQILQKYLTSLGISILFHVSWWGILIAVLQAILMIILSAMDAAVRASKISPIEAIRQSETIKRKGKTKKTPKLYKKLFGACGAVAWQNFRRAKTKYRATTSSIAVSAALIIGMSSLNMLFGFLREEIREIANFQISVESYYHGGFQAMREIAQLPIVDSCVIKSNGLYLMEEDADPLDSVTEAICIIYYLDETSFEKLCMDNGVDPKMAKGKGLVNENLEDYREGMVLRGISHYQNDQPGKQGGVPVSVELAGRFNEKTRIDGRYGTNQVEIYAGESWAKEYLDQYLGWASAFFLTSDANALAKAIMELDIPDSTIVNYDMIYQLINFLKELLQVFGSGFLILIILIGFTNVINAVHFNMALRASEFAKLRSVGMTGKQFRGMVFLEGLFIGIRGLFGGILIGGLIHYGTYYYVKSTADILWEDPEKKFTYGYVPPFLQIILCVAGTAGLLWLVMNHYVKKSENQMIIETIRKENL